MTPISTEKSDVATSPNRMTTPDMLVYMVSVSVAFFGVRVEEIKALKDKLPCWKQKYYAELSIVYRSFLGEHLLAESRLWFCKRSRG